MVPIPNISIIHVAGSGTAAEVAESGATVP